MDKENPYYLHEIAKYKKEKEEALARIKENRKEILGGSGATPRNSIGTNISEALRRKNMTQSELAETVGTTEVTMSRYISGARIPKADILAEIAKGLGTTTDYLLGNEGKPDYETEYYRLLRTIERIGHKITLKQKLALIEAVLDTIEDDAEPEKVRSRDTPEIETPFE